MYIKLKSYTGMCHTVLIILHTIRENVQPAMQFIFFLNLIYMHPYACNAA
jgi:hypothetical protein